MKKIMPWVKANLTIVIISALMLLVLPGAAAGAYFWNSSIKDARQKAVTGVMGQLDQSAVTYSLPPLKPGGDPVSLRLAAPNAEATKFFKEQKARIDAQTTAVVTKAEQINSEGHAPLIPDLFPSSPDKLKTLEFVEALAGKGSMPSKYQKLLDEINAAGPADPAAIMAAIEEIQGQTAQQARESGPAGGTASLTPEQLKQLEARLADVRLAKYRAHAQKHSVYATPDIFPADLPRGVPTDPPDINLAFKWQWDLWAVSDILTAVARANSKDNTLLPLTESPVKRIVSVVVEPLKLAAANPEGGSSDAPPAGPTTLTGRGSTANYDVRYVDLVVIVDSAKLHELLNAISSTNFMTVVGLNMTAHSPYADLDQGFYYGSAHVMKASLRIESVWLRSWTTPKMPEVIKAALTGGAPAGEAAAAAPTPPPAVAAAAEPRQPRAAGKPKPKRPSGK